MTAFNFEVQNATMSDLVAPVPPLLTRSNGVLPPTMSDEEPTAEYVSGQEEDGVTESKEEDAIELESKEEEDDLPGLEDAEISDEESDSTPRTRGSFLRHPNGMLRNADGTLPAAQPIVDLVSSDDLSSSDDDSDYEIDSDDSPDE